MILCTGEILERRMMNYIGLIVAECKWWTVVAILLLGLVGWLVADRITHRLIRRFLCGKHVWVVGGSRGIGRAVALQAGEAGAVVSVTARSPECLAAVVNTLKRKGATCQGVDGDIGRGKQEIRRLYREVVRGHGELDVLVACAGINHSGRWFGGWDSKIDKIIDVNFRGVVHLFDVCLKDMKRRREGTLCAVSSLSAYRGVPGASVYGATKAALTAFCQALNVELWGKQVRVICVHPGFVDTDAIRHLNHFKPFQVTADTAGRHILYAICFRRSHYGFPWIMEHVIMKIARIIPSPLYEALLFHTTASTSEGVKPS